MGEASEDRRRAAMSLKFDRDLLQRFMFSSSSHVSKTEQSTRYEEADDEEEELELSLGLSLGGRFGVDKTAKNKLVRSSSIAGTFPFTYDEDSPSPAKAAATSYAGLMRSSSLPTETEEEWRKRKELQTLRRLAAKRRRSEKQRSTSKGEREDEVEVGPNWSRNIPVAPPFWAAVAAARKAAGADPMKGKVDILGGFQGFGLQPSSQQGSVESQGGSSSGMSELESKSLQGSSSCGEARSPASNQMLQDQRSNQDIAFGSSGKLTPESASRTSRDIGNMCKKLNPPENKEREPRMNAMEDMPCVFTVGDGPNGRKVEGILYRYGKGEEVRIMCVCHGSFLSPAEFVKHAGGSDVAHPLRHITVNHAGTSFL